jgi:hypothetical protein
MPNDWIRGMNKRTKSKTEETSEQGAGAGERVIATATTILRDGDDLNAIPYTDNERRIYAFICTQPNRFVLTPDVIEQRPASVGQRADHRRRDAEQPEEEARP